MSVQLEQRRITATEARKAARAMADAGPAGFPQNLPAELTRFVGRRTELGEIRRALGRSRLLTLVGTGGVGKTRLALRAARDLRRAFADGMTLVEFAGIDDAEGMAAQVAQAFQLRSDSNERQVDVLQAHLRDKQMLLILDNCEHVLVDCAALAVDLLAAGAGVRVIVTSRQSLQVAGEHVLRLPPMTVPDGPDGPSADAVGQYDAVTLFLDRAHATVPGFELNADNCADVVRLCQLLDGIPLAIELAVQRLRVLTPRQLAARLSVQFDLLAGSNQAALPRQRTLQATIDWSYDLCSPQEQHLWGRLAVFVGSFELAAVQAVCESPEVPADEMPELLDGLVDKSVVVRIAESGGVVRYRLLESIRDYANQRLVDGTEAMDLRRRHRDWFAGLAAAAESGTASRTGASWYSRMRADAANVEASLQYCIEYPGDGERGLALAASLCAPHWVCGPMNEVRRWVESALEQVAQPSSARVTALWRASWLASLQGDLTTARRHIASCRALAEQTRDASAAVYAEHFDAGIDVFDGNFARAAEALRVAIERHTGLGDMTGRYYALSQLAMMQCFRGDPDGLGTVDWCSRHANGNANALAWMSWLTAVHSLIAGPPDGTVDRMAEALAVAVASSDQWIPASAAETLAWACAAEEQFDRAAAIFGIAEKMRRDIGCAITGLDILHRPHEQYVASARTHLGDKSYAAHYEAGWALDARDATEFALSSGRARGRGAELSSNGVVRNSLTRREIEVAGLVGQGLSNRDIAAELVIAKRTAETHVEHILAKLGFTTRTQIVAWFAEHALAGAK